MIIVSDIIDRSLADGGWLLGFGLIPTLRAMASGRAMKAANGGRGAGVTVARGHEA
jgi:hypothetical protein